MAPKDRLNQPRSARASLHAAKGFTLIELIVVIVVIGILATIAFPKYLDLTNYAKAAATQATLGAVRSVLYLKYTEAAANGNAEFPSSLVAADFGHSQLPTNQCNGHSLIATVGSAPAGTVESGVYGFWYIVATGQSGAYAKAGAGQCNDTAGW